VVTAESNMSHWRGRVGTTGESLAFGPAMATPAGVAFSMVHCYVFSPLLMVSSSENYVLVL
jgi:alpha-D-ribose 1-methylphosphonate 5-triphosphate synthase subunit PhnG